MLLEVKRNKTFHVATAKNINVDQNAEVKLY
jgi:hypothetical protein